MARAATSLAPVKVDEELSGALLAKFFRALGDATRLRILEALCDGPQTVSELVEAAGCGQSRVSNHLACLRSCRFVVSRTDGRWVTYSLADPQLRSLIALAQKLVHKNATFFALCATVGA